MNLLPVIVRKSMWTDSHWEKCTFEKVTCSKNERTDFPSILFFPRPLSYLEIKLFYINQEHFLMISPGPNYFITYWILYESLDPRAKQAFHRFYCWLLIRQRKHRFRPPRTYRRLPVEVADRVDDEVFELFYFDLPSFSHVRRIPRQCINSVEQHINLSFEMHLLT